ncbi:MAG: serine/threonine protein kinase [Planctomycetes bacterium]|nr:serine/threonine protein kinase [Planctomycetota bacterium]
MHRKAKPVSFTRQQWLRIDELFHATLARNGRSQETFLLEATGGDDVVRAEVERLLDNYRAAGDAFEPPTPQIKDECARLTDRRVGAYRLVRPVASGGMGTVWLAERADDQFRQSVAIKLVTSSILTEDLKKYFRREQQALAQLEHPFITRLIDGGTSKEGWPYLVMEYVDGKPIDIYCDENRLRISDRLELFRKVCAAVHYAHQRLVVHRDLKPNNILVGDDGRPKLLDFGISKLLDAPLDNVGLEATRTLIRGMTPQYASPEQLRGASITTATDVYSLGVILYELLSGHRPHDRNGHSDARWERLVCDTDPIAPSVAVEQVNGIFVRLRKDGTATPDLVGDLRGESTRMLRRRLRGDLDNVVMTSLQKDPRRRYTSVSELSEDVRRYLVRLPVAARKDTVIYRVTKFVKRNNKTVIAGMLGALTLLAGIAGTTVGMHKARDERDVAVKVTDFLEDVFLLATPFREGKNQSWAGFFDATAARIEDELDDEPAVRARAYMAIARAYERMWQWNDVAKYARKALDAYRVVYSDDHASVAESLLLAGKGLAWIENEEAVDMLEDALAIHIDLYGMEDPRTAGAMNRDRSAG